MAAKEEEIPEDGLNYKNTTTNVHPLIVQLYRCELDEDNNKEENKNKNKEKEKSPPDPIFRADEHDKQFDPDKYLEGFYKSPREDVAMQIVLFFLPGMVCRLPKTIGTMLDLGAGPTIYIPLVLRNHIESIFSSDYSPQNRQRVIDWIFAKNSFDWSEICCWIAGIEARHEKPLQMQDFTREKMRAVLEVNVQKRPVIQSIEWKAENLKEIPKQFDLVTTVFCMEYSCETLEGYKRAINGACGLIKPGGWLLQGGIFHATEYRFGGKRFSSHFLTKEHVLTALEENGMETIKGEDYDQFHFITHDDIFLLLSKKKMQIGSEE
ncbi:unnamed protein product [Meloidogyne enterolobii]|uniref:Uncharacterized protein n=1 Tax=Meloidogyne enterolobii TaxID=390850 RepID=A0ACB0XNU3_MELEN